MNFDVKNRAEKKKGLLGRKKEFTCKAYIVASRAEIEGLEAYCADKVLASKEAGNIWANEKMKDERFFGVSYRRVLDDFKKNAGRYVREINRETLNRRELTVGAMQDLAKNVKEACEQGMMLQAASKLGNTSTEL